jgi:hypothetical protein
MNDFFKTHNIEFGEEKMTSIVSHDGVQQDGTTSLYRDVDGKLWAISGQAHSGHIGVFCGTKIEDLKQLYPIKTNFCTGHADYAFNNILFPEGIKPRGSIWPFGLYICPNTHRFFCFVHTETGWDGRGTGYDALGYCNTPAFDSDFRHVGLMHSDDEGKNWTFDRWVLTSEEVCFSERFNPDNVNVLGQKGDVVCLGAGDFTFFDDPKSDYMYIFYTKVYVNLKKEGWEQCNTYVARTRRRTDGIMGDFVKYYDGEFSEAGNFGKETPIFHNAWHTRPIYFKKYDLYVASSMRLYPSSVPDSELKHYMELAVSKDLVNWSDSVYFEKDGKRFGKKYNAIVPSDDKSPVSTIEEDDFIILTNHGNVTYHECKLI